MLILYIVLLLFISSVRTSEISNENGVVNSNDFHTRFSYSFWPSAHNGAMMMKLRKRQVETNKLNEGGDIKISQMKTTGQPAQSPPNQTSTINILHEVSKGNITLNGSEKVTTPMPAVSKDDAKPSNETAINKSVEMNLNSPGVLKRGLIVFGGFALMAIAYFIFYRRKNSKNASTNNTHNVNDANQFRYGVLQTDDRRDNLELSRIPLTMESDEDDDEDLEIFDLEQKKKSLSYVNLEMPDEDIVLNSPTESSRANDRDNLLLDIEDAASDTLINWSNNDGGHGQRRQQQSRQQRWRLHASSVPDCEPVQRHPQQESQRRPKQSWQRRHASTNGSGWVPADASSHELIGGGSTQNNINQIACHFKDSRYFCVYVCQEK